MLSIQRKIMGLTLAVLICGGATAGEVEEQGRAILEKNKAAVVTVQLVIKEKFAMNGMANEGESKQEATGTVISPEGLTILSLIATDPTTMYESMGMGDDFQVDSELTSVNILTEDGGEIAAEIILRDTVLDLAYLRPVKKPETAMAYVDLAQAGEVDVLDRVITINRLGRVAKRIHGASFERIVAKVTKPRTFYIPGSDPSSTALGSPAFTMDGKIVGIFVLRMIKANGGGGSMFGGMDNVSSIICTAEDILEGVEQVPPYEAEKSE